jgi:UDP-glucuronate 4-epimerase
MDFIEEIERQLGKTAKKNLLPLQPGDVPASHADVSDLMADLGYKPQTSVRDGIAAFLNWYKDFYSKQS